MSDCIFCKIVSGQIPCYKVYEDDYVLAFLDIANDVYGHTLVIPKAHCTNLLDADEQCLAKVMTAVQKVGQHYVANCGFDGFNTFNCNGKDAEQSVFHLHIHVIPRKNGDAIHIWSNKGKQTEDLAEICNKLKLSN